MPSHWLLCLVLLVVGSPSPSKMQLKDPGEHGGFFSFAWSADGRFLAGGTAAMESYSGGAKKTIGGDAVLWDASSGEILGRFGGHEKNVDWVAFARDGELLFAGSQENGLIQAWTRSNATVPEFRYAPGTPFSGSVLPVVSSDGRTLAVVSAFKTKIGKKRVTRHTPLRVLDVGTGRERWKVDGADVRALAVDPTGKWLAVFFRQNWRGTTRLTGRSAKQWIEIRDLATGRVDRIIEKTWNVHALTFLADGRSLAAVTNKDVFLWPLRSGGQQTRLSVAGKSTPRGIAFSADGKRFAFSRFMGDRVEVWGLTERRPLGVLELGAFETAWLPVFSRDLDRMVCRQSGPAVIDLTRLPAPK